MRTRRYRRTNSMTPSAPSSRNSPCRSRARSRCSAITPTTGSTGLPADYWDTYPARITAVTAADVPGRGGQTGHPSRLQIVAVGDASKITEVMKKKGQVEVYDVDGNPAK